MGALFPVGVRYFPKGTRSHAARRFLRTQSRCSKWENFHESLSKANILLQNNQYPPSFFDPLIKKTIQAIVSRCVKTTELKEDKNTEQKLIFVQYRSKASDQFEKSLKKLEIPCKV